MNEFLNLSAKQRVFGILRNLVVSITDADDVNSIKDQLIRSLENAISWEPLIFDEEKHDNGGYVRPNVVINRRRSRPVK